MTLATQENRARFEAIAARLGMTCLEVDRAWTAVELVDDLEAEYGPLDDLKVQRLIRRLRATGRLSPGPL